jgi:hypothetical protein
MSCGGIRIIRFRTVRKLLGRAILLELWERDVILFGSILNWMKNVNCQNQNIFPTFSLPYSISCFFCGVFVRPSPYDECSFSFYSSPWRRIMETSISAFMWRLFRCLPASTSLDRQRHVCCSLDDGAGNWKSSFSCELMHLRKQNQIQFSSCC